VRPLAQLPPGWLVAYNDYFAENGWEDHPKAAASSPAPAPPLGAARERAFRPRAAATAAAGRWGGAPHWAGARPAGAARE
jgi:hypothetical protein